MTRFERSCLALALAVFAVGCGYRLVGIPHLACAAGLPVLVPIDAGPEER